MFDIYKLFYFIEETGLLIQEKWYKVTHPEVWNRNQRAINETEECYPEEDDIAEQDGMAIHTELLGHVQDEAWISKGTGNFEMNSDANDSQKEVS